jgi:hypothetical protein
VGIQVKPDLLPLNQYPAISLAQGVNYPRASPGGKRRESRLQGAFLLFDQPACDDLRAVVAEFFGNGLAIVAVDDLAPRPVAIDQDRHQDPVLCDVVREGEELLGRQGRQL